MGHGTIFVYSILSVLELSEVLWGMYPVFQYLSV